MDERSRIQLRAILRKNWLLTQRNRRDLAREVLWPIVLLAVLVVMRSSFSNVQHPEVLVQLAERPVVRVRDVQGRVRVCRALQAPPRPFDIGMQVIGVAAATGEECPPILRTITENMAAVRPLLPPSASRACASPARRQHREDEFVDSTFQCFNSSAALQRYALDTQRVFAGVVFHQPSLLTAGVPADTIAYSIRLNHTTMPAITSDPPVLASDPADYPSSPDPRAQQFSPEFLTVQRAVDAALIRVLTGTPEVNITQWVRQFPWPAYSDDLATVAMSSILPMYLVLIFSLQVRAASG